MDELQEYKTKSLIKDSSDKDREVSDTKYAIKLVETIFFGLLTFCALGVLGYLGNIIVKVITK